MLVIVLASCSNYSGNRVPKSSGKDEVINVGYRDVPFRAHKTWFSTVTYDRIVDHNVQIVYADSAYRDGDTITVGSNDFIIQERVK